MSLPNITATLKTVTHDIDRFLRRSAYTASTCASYEYHLKHLFEWIRGHGLALPGLTADELGTYLKESGWRNNTCRLAGNAAKSFLRWRYGADHPALELRLPKDDSGPGRSLSQRQLEELLATFDTTKPIGWRDLSMIGLMVETGIREAEICRLELRYLDLERRHFDVLAKKEVWREGAFSEVTACYLSTWIEERTKIARVGTREVFVGIRGLTKGCKMTPGGLRANFRRYGRRMQVLIKLSPHDLRRTMAMLLTLRGAPTRIVQKLGAWADVGMVERYTRGLQTEQIDEYTPLKPYRLFK